MRHSRGRRNLTYIILRRLHNLAKRQCGIEKVVSRACTKVDQLGSGKRLKLFPARFLISEIAPNQATIGLAQANEQFARLMVRHTRDIQALVRFTSPKYGNVKHGQFWIFDLRFLIDAGIE